MALKETRELLQEVSGIVLREREEEREREGGERKGEREKEKERGRRRERERERGRGVRERWREREGIFVPHLYSIDDYTVTLRLVCFTGTVYACLLEPAGQDTCGALPLSVDAVIPRAQWNG